MVRMKLTGMIVAANIPKLLIGISFEKLLARNAKPVVDDVTSIALEARRQVYAIHFLRSP